MTSKFDYKNAPNMSPKMDNLVFLSFTEKVLAMSPKMDNSILEVQ